MPLQPHSHTAVHWLPLTLSALPQEEEETTVSGSEERKRDIHCREWVARGGRLQACAHLLTPCRGREGREGRHGRAGREVCVSEVMAVQACSEAWEGPGGRPL